jgi:hypothetical protein
MDVVFTSSSNFGPANIASMFGTTPQPYAFQLLLSALGMMSQTLTSSMKSRLASVGK